MTSIGAGIQIVGCLPAPRKGWSTAGRIGETQRVQDALHNRVQNRKAGKAVQSAKDTTERKRKVICR